MRSASTVGIPLTIGIPIPREYKFQNYFNAIEALGAKGIKVGSEDEYALCDALLLPGGVDVDPQLYHQPVSGAVNTDPELDAMQTQALAYFMKRRKPVFGICRGHQLINAFLGGSLIQDLSCRVHVWNAETDEDSKHETKAAPGSWIAALYGESFVTNSAHHQAVDRPGEGMVIDQWGPDDVAEASHHMSLPVWTVQWHPERMCFAHHRADTVDGSAVIGWFLEQCAASLRGK